MILKSLWIQKLRWNPQNPKECMQWSRSPSQRSWRPSWNRMIPILMNMTMSILPLVSWPCVLIPTLIWQSILMRGGLWARNTGRWYWKVSTISTTMIVWCNPVLGCSLKFPMELQGLQSSRHTRLFSRIFLSTPMTSVWMPRIWTAMLGHVVGVTCSRVAHWSLLQLSTVQNIIHCVMGILYLSWNSYVMPQGVDFSLLMSRTLNDGNHSKHHRFHISTKLVLLLCQMMMNSFKVFKTGLCIDNWMTFWIGSFVNGFVIGHLSVNWRIRWGLLSQQRSLKRLRNMVGTGMQLMAQRMLHCRIRLRTWQHEETLLDEVDIPGLPEDESERRRSWRKLPQRVRIAVRRLHRAFGHVPKSVMVNLVRAAKVSKEFVDAVKLHRCETCEKTSAKKPTHKVTLPSDYTFNHTLGIDVLELTDVTGQKYQVLNMVCIGTCFQQAEVVKVGAGQASSRSCLDALIKRWFSWAGHPVAIMCDRGLHNRGVLQQYMDEHNIQVHHVPLESPESLGRVERHGGLLKALFRRVCTEVGGCTKEQVESCITQVLGVKNDSARVGGFSPSQWVLGRAPRGVASLMSEEDHAQLGAIQARHDPSSIFALQHLARIEAQKAFVHLDCSRRVQRALTRNASVFDREFNIGDLVTFRRDNQRGGTSWSPTCRVIGHENQKNIWLLCGNVPVLVASHNIRIASPSEALAQSVLNGEPVIPYKVINDTGQQAFLDARQADEVEVVRAGPRHAVDVEVVHEDIADSALPPIPEEPDDEWDIRPGFFEEDEEEDTGPMEEDIFSPSRTPERRVERPRPGDGDHERNVRPRVESQLQPESERGSSLVPSRRDSFVPDSTPSGSVLGPLSSPSASSWPLRRELLNDLPHQLRTHLERARERDSERSPEERQEARALFASFLSQEVDGVPEDEELGKKVLKSIHYESAPPDVQKNIMDARTKEWNKFLEFAAVVEISKEDAERLIVEGHQCIPSKWVDVDKNQFMKGRTDQEYVPKFKSRLVSCGNFEVSEGLRSDSPTADTEAHNILCCWAAIQGAQLHSADVASAYFQGRPLDRVLIMRQPRGGLPGVDPEVFFLVRVPVYGLTDSGRGFWLRLDGDARSSGPIQWLETIQVLPRIVFSSRDRQRLRCTYGDSCRWHLVRIHSRGKVSDRQLLGEVQLGI